MVRGIGRWFWHVFEGMVRGCLVMGVLAAIVTFGGVFLLKHSLPHNLTLVLVLVIIGISGVLGAAFMLIWRLSHIKEIAHLTEKAVEEVTHHG